MDDQAFDWIGLLTHVATYVIAYLTATGKAARLAKVLKVVTGAIEAEKRHPLTGHLASTLIKHTPEGDSEELRSALDKSAPHASPRVTRRRRILSAVLDLVPVIGALRRTPR